MATLTGMVRPADEPAYGDAKRDIGDNLRRARESAGLEREQVAAQLGVSPAMVGHWETGRHVPPWDRIVRLCRVIDADPHKVLRPILGEFQESSPTVETARRDVDVALRRLDRALSAERVAGDPTD